MTFLRLREAVRALVMDPDDHVLLVNFDWPGLGIEGGFWACPGGGIEPGESPEEALRRELHEEVGLTHARVLGPVWQMTRVFAMQDFDGQTDLTYLVRTARFEPTPRVDLAAENVHGVRWFSPTDLAGGNTVFGPRDLAAQIAVVLDQGVPPVPRQIPALD